MTENLATLSHAKNMRKKKENTSNKLSDLAKEISRRNVETVLLFLLLRIAICTRRDKLKEGLLNKKESRLSAYEIFQMTENAKIAKWLPGKNQIQGSSKKTWSKDEAEAVTVKSYFNYFFKFRRVLTFENSTASKQLKGNFNKSPK